MNGGTLLLTVLQILFATLAIGISIFMISTDSYHYQNYVTVILIFLMLVMATKEFKEKRKMTGWLLIAVAGFLLFVVVRGLLFF